MMKRVAVMQPYFFPYLGYFQLIDAVDTFVIYDDVNYIKKGWINRNCILANGQRQLITLPIRAASQNRRINELELTDSPNTILERIRHNYRKAPNFAEAFDLARSVLSYSETNLARFLRNGIEEICRYLGLRRGFIFSSELANHPEDRGTGRILNICGDLAASQYINLPGGRSLYDSAQFSEVGLDLHFIEPRISQYPQFGASFVPNLSIIDVMMFNDRAGCAALLKQYELD